jgi:hypothetical protein
MSTATVTDYRRTDQRTNVLENPFWLSSGVVDAAAVSGLKDGACILFSFPTAGQIYKILDVAVYVAVAFTATTIMNIGIYTLATDAVTTGGLATLVTVGVLIPTGDITATTIGWYYPASAQGFLSGNIAGTRTANVNMIVGAAATVPAVAMTLATGTPIVGKAQVHMLVTINPGT